MEETIWNECVTSQLLLRGRRDLQGGSGGWGVDQDPFFMKDLQRNGADPANVLH